MKAFPAVALSMVGVLAFAATAPAQITAVPNLVNYQGRLLNGTNLFSGAISVSFRLYESATGGFLWCEDSNNVEVVDGLYSAFIGDTVVAGSLDQALIQTQVWIEVVVGTNVLAPREPLVSVGYARYAGAMPPGSIQGLMIGNGQVWGNHILDGQVDTADLAMGAVNSNRIDWTDMPKGLQDGDDTGLVSESDPVFKAAAHAGDVTGLWSNLQLAADAVTGAEIVDGTVSNADVAANTFWETGGNAGTVAGTHYLGTADNRPLEIRVHNQRAALFVPSNGAPNIVLGSEANTISNNAGGAVILGGSNNVIGAGSGYSAIGGGRENTIENGSYFSTVAGGASNRIQVSAERSVIGGGANHSIGQISKSCTIAGGWMNRCGFYSRNNTIGGGYNNEIGQDVEGATIAGGESHDIAYRALYSTIGGGAFNSIQRTSCYSVVAGGYQNVVAEDSPGGVIGGGAFNDINPTSSYSSIGGGCDNRIFMYSAGGTIGGGISNEIGAASVDSTVAGGRQNLVRFDAGQSTIGGGVSNTVEAGARGAVIAGGVNNFINYTSEYSTISGGHQNSLNRDCNNAVIGGGSRNGMNYYCTNATISGGWKNYIEWGGAGCSIGGGYSNAISFYAAFSTIPGGLNNSVGQDAKYAFAAGRRAKANHRGAFVWGDSTDLDVSSTNTDSVTMRAAGGYRLFSNSSTNLGAILEPGATAWSALSDRDAKENFTPVDAEEILQQIAGLPITEWNYKADPNRRRYIGPVAQDFQAAFGLGSDRTINTLDTDGVTLAAIQGLYQAVQELREENAALRHELEQLKAQAP
ncbi:MAG: tail fiber domain-containing protein [Kiritimatiellae bacterium]|nr:tail fiber domain-containing protein [Kiritimatiellia bacterium]